MPQVKSTTNDIWVHTQKVLSLQMKGVKMYDRLNKTMMEEYSHEYITMLGEKIMKVKYSNIQMFTDYMPRI